jgi:hypothetical protein
MPIQSSDYIDITSGVGGAAATDARELKLRLYTTNELVPTGETLTFGSDSEVLAYFGSDSEEYKRAVYYFGFVSKSIESPQNIQFTRWADTDTSAQIWGDEAESLATIQAITSGSITVNVGGSPYALTGLDFSADTSYADVATTVQAALVAAGLTNTTVTYEATDTAFNMDTVDTINGEISVTDVDSTTAGALGWGSGAIFSAGIAEQSVTDVIDEATTSDNDYGSFLFIDDLSESEHVEASIWNDAKNVLFMYLVRVTEDNASDMFGALGGYGGTGLILVNDDVLTEYHDQFPAELLASTDYDDTNASKNYMYQQDSRRTAIVTDSTTKATYDALRVNYFGQTQEAGTLLEFFQPGQLCGGSTDPLAMGVYANEMWLKSELKADGINMFLALEQVPADNAGLAIWNTYLEAKAEAAVFNGVFSTSKTLTTTQKLYIDQLTGDANAYLDVASKGYWYSSEITSETTDGVTTYSIEYTLVYAKRDSVDAIDGKHVLI